MAKWKAEEEEEEEEEEREGRRGKGHRGAKPVPGSDTPKHILPAARCATSGCNIHITSAQFEIQIIRLPDGRQYSECECSRRSTF